MKANELDYKEKYREALERAKTLYENANGMILKKWVEQVFPELQESEDKKIMKCICLCLEECVHNDIIRDYEKDKCLAWLKKQDEAKESSIPQHEGTQKDTSCKENDDSLTSEDERKRKAIYIYLDWLEGRKDYAPKGKYSIRDMLAWLEKQGEQKPYGQRQECSDCHFNYAGECKGSCQMKRGEQKPTDNVEPKFHEGEWVVYECGEETSTLQIAGILGIAYVLSDCSILGMVDEDSLRLWDITKDAKNGDVLAYKDEISIYKHDIKNCTKEGTNFGGFVYHCCYDGKRFITDSLYSLTEKDKKDIYPATKEQRDTLFAKMKEAGYEWDVKKKELKKQEIAEIPFGAKDSELQEAVYNIPKGFHAEVERNKVVIKQGEHNSAWSEEDTETLYGIVNYLFTSTDVSSIEGSDKWYDWLKSLKDRVQT